MNYWNGIFFGNWHDRHLHTYMSFWFSSCNRAFFSWHNHILNVQEHRWKPYQPVQAHGDGAWACLAHALQCLCDGRACCPALFMQLVICRSWGFTGTVTLLFQLVIFTGKVRVGMKIPQDGNRANQYRHVAVVHGHDWRTLCSVCKTGARVAQPVPCNS